MTQKQYDLLDRIAAIEEAVRRANWRQPGIPGVQVLPNGTPYFQGGVSVGPGREIINEPTQVPVPTALDLSWGSSFDTIYIDVEWSAPAGYGADQVVGFLVQATKLGGTGVPLELTTKGTSVRFEPVEPHSEYLIMVASLTKTGRPSNGITDTIETGGDTSVPDAPTFPAGAVTEGIEALSIKWNPNTERDVANGAGQYRVRVSANSDLSSPAYDVLVNGTTVWAAPLIAGESYYVGVTAIDSSGNESDVGTPSGGPWEPLANVTDTSAIAFGGGNVVKNSGFEAATLENWTLVTNGATIARATDAYAGAFGGASVKISGASANASVYQDIALTKGDWVVSCWAKADSVAGGGSGVVLNVDMVSGTEGSRTLLLGDASTAAGDPNAGQGTFDWKRLAVRMTITSATATIRVQLHRGYFGPCTGTVWFDQVQVEQGDTLTGYAPRPDEILSGTITTTMIGDDQITTPKLAAGSVVAGTIAADSIGTTHLQATAVTTAKLAAGAVTTAKLDAGAVTANEIAANAVTTAKLNANAVTTAKLAANSVTATELAAISMAVGKYIQSTGYVSNTSGWRIDGNGNAEFNNVSIRGTINAARLGTDLFDFMRPGGDIAARFQFTSSEHRFYLGEGAVNAGQYMYYDTTQNRFVFKGGLVNDPAWEFTRRVRLSNGVYSPNGYAAGQWGSGSGYFIAGDAAGNVASDWGLQFQNPVSGQFFAMLRGYLDSDQRHVGFENANGSIQQVYIDCYPTSNPADTRSLTRTGWITFSATHSKSSVKDLGKSVKAREVIRSLNPKKYKVKAGRRVSQREHFGLLAEEVREVLPEAVHDNLCFANPKTAKPEDWGPGIDYQMFIPLLLQGHKEQDEEIKELRDEISKLRGLIERGGNK